MQLHFREERGSYFVLAADRIYRIEAHCAEYIPCRHLPAIFVAAKTGRFVSMCVLTDHSRTEQWKFGVCCWMIGEHTIQFLGKSVFAAYKVYQSVDIVLY